MKLVSILLIPYLALTGCAYLTSRTEKTTDPNTRIVTEYTKVRCYTLFDGNAALTKFRNSAGGMSSNGMVFTSGTTIQGLTQEASGTNVNDLVGTVVSAAVQGAVTAAKKP